MDLCSQDCNLEGYEATMSQSTWPGTQHTLLLTNEFMLLNAEPLVQQFLDDTITRGDTGVRDIQRSFADNFLKVRVYLKDLRVEVCPP